MNIVTTAGLTALLTDGYAQWDYLAVGTGIVAAPTVSTTALATEIDRVTMGSRSASAGQLILEAMLYNNDGVGTLTEVGVFDAASGGNLLAYVTLSSSTVKTANEALIFSLTITLGND